MAKIAYYDNSNILLSAPSSYDIYIMDMDSEANIIELGTKLKSVDSGGYFLYLSQDSENVRRVPKSHKNLFLVKPIEKEELIAVLAEIKQAIKDDSIMIKTALGDRRIRVNNLNYINIVKRCLCYHLTDGNIFDGQTLRTSFEKAIHPLEEHKAFIFIAPSLLINIGEIKILHKDHIQFENDDVLYYPMKHYDIVRAAWIEYNRFVNV